MLVALVLLIDVGCGDKKKETPEPAAPPPAEVTPAEPAVTPASDAEVAHLIADCVAQGVAADKCACAGEAAKSALGSALAVKTSKQPAADDPAMQTYYSRAEINTVMGWIRGATESCGIEEGL